MMPVGNPCCLRPHRIFSHPRTFGPSCLVLDVKLPGLSGLDLQQQMASDRTNIPIIFITGWVDVPITVRALKAGAVEFLTKPFSEEVLLKAIRSALDRSQATQKEASELKMLQDRYASLTGRQREILELVISGLMNKQVGGELGISEITVKAHRGRMMRKMKAGSLAELVSIAGKLQIPQQGCRPMSISNANLQRAEASSRNHAMRSRCQIADETAAF